MASKPKSDDDSTTEDVVQFEWREKTFTLPKDMDDWETDACIALSDASRSSLLKDMREAIRLCLGESQWAVLQSLGTKRKDLKQFASEFGRVVDEDCV